MKKTLLVVVGCAALAIVGRTVWSLSHPVVRFPLIYNPASFVSEEEIHQIEQLVRNRGERYLLSINIVNTNKAGVTTAHADSHSRSGRTYNLSRKDTGWAIDSSEEWKN